MFKLQTKSFYVFVIQMFGQTDGSEEEP